MYKYTQYIKYIGNVNLPHGQGALLRRVPRWSKREGSPKQRQCVWTADSLCCTAVTDTEVQSSQHCFHYTQIQKE